MYQNGGIKGHIIYLRSQSDTDTLQHHYMTAAAETIPRICALIHVDDLDQPALSRSLIRIFHHENMPI